jgi:hypothetical protein
MTSFKCLTCHLNSQYPDTISLVNLNDLCILYFRITITGYLDFVHHLVFWKEHNVLKTGLFPSSVIVIYMVIQKEVYTFKNVFYKYYWTYGDVLYIDWKENSQSYFHTVQALDVSPMCDVADVKSIIQLFPHSLQHVPGNSSHSLSDAPLRIIAIRTSRDFRSIHTQDMDLVSVGFVK